MRFVWVIGSTDLRLFLRNRASWVWLFVMPLIFVLFMGFANRGPGGPASPRPTVRVENADAGFLGSQFLELLGDQGLHVVSPTNAGDARRGLVIPADFSASVFAGRQGRVTFQSLPGSESAASALVEIRVVRALIALNALLLEQAATHPGSEPTRESLALLRARPEAVTLKSTHAGRKPIPTGFGFSLPGVLVMYLLMNLLIFGATSLTWERRSGVLRRIVTHPVTRLQLLAGKLLGLLLLAAAQITFLLVCGHFLFGVNLGDQFAGILTALLVYAWVCASFGLLAGSVIRGEDKVVGLCVMASMVMSALGGCWWPLEIVPAWVQRLAHAFPTAWAMDALHQLITFGAGLGAAAPALGVLALFGLAANALAIRLFRV